MDLIFDWFLINYQEFFGTLISLIYLFFSVIQNKWLWPLGFVSSAIYVIIFYKAGIYADMGLQLYYVVISVYGWYNWTKLQNKQNQNGKVKSVLKMHSLIFTLVIITVLLFVFLSQILIHFTNSTVPYVDSFTTALSITATWMLAKKYLEHWLLWIVVDTVSAGVYFYKELYITIFLYVVYSIFAIIGYFMWRESIDKIRIDSNQT